MWTNTTDQLVKGIIIHGVDILERCNTADDIKLYLDRISEEYLDYPVPQSTVDPSNWFIPENYKLLDIETLCLDLCTTEKEKDRVKLELQLYQENNFIPVLQAIKYVIDTLRKNNIVWGVGRGSSVASYVLFLLGVHKIDSIKYDIPIEEFFKGEING